MTRELFWLTLTVILTGLLWVPYVLNRCQVRGLGGARRFRVGLARLLGARLYF